MPEFSKGLEGVVAAETEMSFIDGQQGVLEYVGIAIGDLARSSTFEETVFLLWNKKLPTQAELDAFTTDLRANYDPPAGVLEMVKGMVLLLAGPATSGGRVGWIRASPMPGLRCYPRKSTKSSNMFGF